MTRRLTVLAALATCVVASCSSSDSSTDTVVSAAPGSVSVSTPSVTEPPTTSPTADTETVATEPGAAVATADATCEATGDVEPKITGDPLTISPLFGTDIVASSASCSEQITIRFSGDLEDPTGFPGWNVQYVDDPAPTVGVTTLLIEVGALMPNDAGEGYDGPTEIVPADVSHILKMTQTANADGSSTWAVDLDAVYPFDVVSPDGPARIVIDLQTGS